MLTIDFDGSVRTTGGHAEGTAVGAFHEQMAELRNEDVEFEIRAKLKEQLKIQANLIEKRPEFPTHAPVEETDLADGVTYHDPHYKTVIDTIRIACLNAEACFADELSQPPEETPRGQGATTKDC